MHHAAFNEKDVRLAAKFQGYDLVRFPGGYPWSATMNSTGNIVASTLELIVDFLKH